MIKTKLKEFTHDEVIAALQTEEQRRRAETYFEYQQRFGRNTMKCVDPVAKINELLAKDSQKVGSDNGAAKRAFNTKLIEAARIAVRNGCTEEEVLQVIQSLYKDKINQVQDEKIAKLQAKIEALEAKKVQ